MTTTTTTKSSSLPNPNTTTTTATTTTSSTTRKPIHIVIIHLDLGIGGAEQLILQLAQASIENTYELDIVTTRCDPHHCFASVKPGTGQFYPNLHVWGRWIPHHVVAGKYGKAICSTIRLLYLTFCVASCKKWSNGSTTVPDVIVLDVLPTPLPILQYLVPASSTLFYCHYPDQLLVQNADRKHRSLYRRILDWIEEQSMVFSDLTVVNSKFTRQTVFRTFPLLQNDNRPIPVVYPALDVTSSSSSSSTSTTNETPSFYDRKIQRSKKLILSLNRYERKKNLVLLIEAMAYIRDEGLYDINNAIEIVIAGGYDTRNVENVEYRAELGQIADQYNVPIRFLQSISDEQRTMLLQEAYICVYTPMNEHFGIVPLEAMYYGSPVVACNSGGPMETVVDGLTGYLCQEPTAESFGTAITKLLTMSVSDYRTITEQCRNHVINNFSPSRLTQEWKSTVEQTIQNGIERRKKQKEYHDRYGWIYYWIEALLILLLVFVVTSILRYFGILHPNQSIVNKVKTILYSDEL